MKSIEKGILHRDISLSGFNTWRIGGKAEKLYWPHDLPDLQYFLSTLPEDEPLTWIGLGSNMLIRDGGVKGTVILTQGALNDLKHTPEGFIRAESGVASAQAARFSARYDYTGGEFLAGVPGSIGGNLVMNAGACGSETWDSIHHVETINRQGQINERSPAEFDISYRSMKGLPENEWFAAAVFEFQKGEAGEPMKKIRSILDHRTETQPANLPCCGCVFKNPEGNFASKMIDELGLKGTQIGGLRISEKHANFMINTGDATAKDVEAMIALVRAKVHEAYGVELNTEVKMVGE